jgi:hypothetical protein
VGPTYDGRLKPDIISPGDSVHSVLASDPGSGPTCALTDSTGMLTSILFSYDKM